MGRVAGAGAHAARRVRARRARARRPRRDAAPNGECFKTDYRYIAYESCSQFDSLPRTHILSMLKATFERDAEARQASTRALIRANLSMLTALSTDGPALDGAWRALREEGGGHRAAGGSFALRSLAQRRKGSTADELEAFRTTPLDHSGLSLLRQIAQVGHAGLRWTLPRVGWAWWRAGGELPALLRANGAKARALARDDARLPALLAVAAAGERKVSLFSVGITVTFCTNPANNLTSPLIYII